MKLNLLIPKETFYFEGTNIDPYPVFDIDDPEIISDYINRKYRHQCKIKNEGNLYEVTLPNTTRQFLLIPFEIDFTPEEKDIFENISKPQQK